MSSLESFAFRLAQDADLRAAFAADPKAVLAACDLALGDAHRSTLARLCSQLALPAESLLKQLLSDTPDDPNDPWLWAAASSLPAFVEP